MGGSHLEKAVIPSASTVACHFVLSEGLAPTVKSGGFFNPRQTTRRRTRLHLAVAQGVAVC
jgi:hypothetical protein